ncbi:unnamed protein product [Protopolystoma xenopodis]|uniref:Uncharacterized protein n=1 Tax=Protopolystoma xenopodis TaxID=117903 RepID=A0A3S5A0W6_9PLAT|nr:unnamed protein product [Protopolystoma xenopodis]
MDQHGEPIRSLSSRASPVSGNGSICGLEARFRLRQDSLTCSLRDDTLNCLDQQDKGTDDSGDDNEEDDGVDEDEDEYDEEDDGSVDVKGVSEDDRDKKKVSDLSPVTNDDRSWPIHPSCFKQPLGLRLALKDPSVHRIPDLCTTGFCEPDEDGTFDDRTILPQKPLRHKLRESVSNDDPASYSSLLRTTAISGATRSRERSSPGVRSAHLEASTICDPEFPSQVNLSLSRQNVSETLTAGSITSAGISTVSSRSGVTRLERAMLESRRIPTAGGRHTISYSSERASHGARASISAFPFIASQSE